MTQAKPFSSGPVTLPALLADVAARQPDLVVLRFDSGEQFTAAALQVAVRTMAANLQAQGVRQGEYVLCWLPNGPLGVMLYLALNVLGAIFVPVNTAYRGRLLEHVIRISGARRLIADSQLVDRLDDIDHAALETVYLTGALSAAPGDLQIRSAGLLTAATGTGPDLSRDIAATDTSAVIFTSGTTGPSKGVLCSHLHLYTSATEFRHVGPGDTNLVALPLFHVGGILGLWFALVHGGCAAYVERFSTSRFWSTVDAMGVTAVGLLGAMVQYLMDRPPSPRDRQHPVKRAVIAPFGDDALAFGERFGIEVHTEFNMTELSVPLWGGPNPAARGTCGKPRPGVDLKLVDPDGARVPVGAVGELLVHVEDPWTISHGYLHDPGATADTWRDGWFHTGDLFTRDADDNYFFVDRAKDAIRRKGENISSFEVEEELLAYPGIVEAAVVAVPGDGGEDEAMAVLVTADNRQPDMAALTAFLGKRLAHFMVPRYFQYRQALPKTPTQKVEKHSLRSTGITPDTLDRVAMGITLDNS